MEQNKSIGLNDQNTTTMVKKDVQEKDPSQKMHLTDRIHSFDYLSWSAMVLMFTSVWQIAIPYSWVDSGTEKWLGSTSIFILIYSVAILLWAKHNHSIHKDFYAKSLLQHKQQNGPSSNPTSVQELIQEKEVFRPSTILDFHEFERKDEDDEKNVEIAGIAFAKFSFILSLMLVILLSGLLIGNEMFEGYFKAIEEANHVFSVQNDDAKKTSVLLLSQTLCTLLTIINFLYIAYEISQLILYPSNFSAILNYFICSFCCISTLCFLFHIYLLNYIKIKEFNTLQHQGCITQIGILSFIAGVTSLVFMFYNFFNTRSKKPNQKMYLWYTVIYFVFGGVVFAQSLIIYMDVKNSQPTFHGNCISTVRDYSQEFLEVIGCPRKYFRNNNNQNYEIYDMNCNEEQVGLVWEEDLFKNVTSKTNNRSCINVNCCKLIGEFSSVQFWTFLILSTSLCANSTVIFFFALILYTQKDKESIKVSPKVLSSTKFAIFVILILVFATISSAAFLFLDLQGMTAPPKRPHIPFEINVTEKSPQKQQQDKMQQKQNNYYDLTTNERSDYGVVEKKNSTGNKVYQDIIPQSQIKGCRLVPLYLNDVLQFDKYENTYCKSNNSTCNYQSGYNVCLGGKRGTFSLSPTYQSKNMRIKQFIVWDPYRIVRGKEGQIEEDEFCFSAILDVCQSFLNNNLYFCVDEKLTDQEVKGFVILKSLTKEVLHFPSIPDSVSILNKEPEQFEDLNPITHSYNFKHNPNKKHEKKKEEEADKVTLYEAGDKNWVNLSIYSFSAEDGVILNESEILIFPNQSECASHNFETQYPIRRQLTNSNGTSLIYNLPWGFNYTIHYRHDDYLYNCVMFNSMSAGSGTTYQINAPLVNKFKDKQTFKLLLSWSTPLLSLRLSGTFNVGTTFQCQVGFYQSECGGMNSKHSQSSSAQVITVDEIGSYQYLFYVEHIMEYQNLRNSQDYPEIELLQEDKIHLKQLNQLFYQSGAVIKVYVKERVMPVSEYKLPPILLSQIMRQRRPTWLAVCMDGKIGSVTQSPLNKYWEKVKEPKNYWESKLDNTILPNSSICQKFYDSLEHNS